MRRTVSSLPLLPLALALNSAFAADIEPALSAQARTQSRVDALIVFADQSRPLLAPMDAKADYRERRRVLVDALRARAQVQQAGVRQWLDANAIAYRPYWIANTIAAKLSASDLAALARRDDIARVAANPQLSARLPRPAAGTPAPQAVESIAWGVSKINAPAAWAAGYTGQDVVIAGEDTGYQWDHPALQPQYRGWDGSAADHDHNWHDSIHDSVGNPCGNDSTEPCDDYGHGTHTAGTFAGDDGGTHQIGVAPGAKWIGCRNMDVGTGTPARYIECMQWMLAPTDLAGENPDPDLAPDVINNSWGCPPEEGCTVGDELQAAVDSVVAGGIFFAAAAANDGPGCSTITAPPAIYDSSFVVGATDSDDDMAGFSSRGPVVGVGLIRPDLSAPGVNITSSWPPNTYVQENGTSMATPHVAGTVALILSAVPALKGHPDQVAEILRATAVTDGITDSSNSGCGGLTMSDWPNYQAGYGRLDAWAAVQAALAGEIAADTVFADGFDD